MRSSVVLPSPTIRCTCPRHPGGTNYVRMLDFVFEHQGIDPNGLLESEVRIVVPAPLRQPVSTIYVGRLDDAFERTEDLILVTVFPEEGECEVAFKRSKWDTWGPPTVLREAEQ